MGPGLIARSFAEYGFYVFPLYRGGNNQRLKPFGWARNEVLDPEKLDKAIPATSDPLEVERWPELVKKKYNSEVVGFGVLGLGCVVIDVDVKGGKLGLSEFQTMISEHGVPKPTMITVTKSGGLHAYYRRPPDMDDAHVKTIAGVIIGNKRFHAIDLRGNGGFVVGPDKLVDDVRDRTPGQYVTKNLSKISDLPEFPSNILSNWLRTHSTSDLENMISVAPQGDDFRSQIRRGVIPDFVPKGARNESFFLFVNVLRNRGVPKAVAKQMCHLMAQRVEEPETFEESVDIDEILNRVYVVRQDSPYDVAVDLVDCGLFQLTGHKPKLHYVILNENPYVSSKSPHDESSMRTLLAQFQQMVLMDNGKTKLVNPMDVVTRIIRDENRVDTLGFKPNAGQVFSIHDDPGSKKFLNTFRPIMIPTNGIAIDLDIWDEFRFLLSRLFGPEGSDEFQLGMDFIAWMIQKPHIKPSIAPFIMSHHRGVGKSLLFNVIIQVLGTSKDGDRQGRLTKLDEISGRFFNPTGCILNLIDEVQFPVHKDARKESVTFWRHMKNLITAETISVEIKGGMTYQMPNSAALILAGNSGGNFPVEEMDRRLWMIDNNPAILGRGTVDKLFQLVKGIDIEIDDRIKLVNTLRKKLSDHVIKYDLDSIRAPMTDIKREMFLNSLTDMEEWFIGYFENVHNLFTETPIISKSAFVYVIETLDPLKSMKWSEETETLWRDLRRRGYLKPVRMKNNNHQSRQFACPQVGSDGKLYQTNKREILYTTREHGMFDEADSKSVLHAFMRNVHTIKYFKGQKVREVAKILEAGASDDFEGFNVQE